MLIVSYIPKNTNTAVLQLTVSEIIMRSFYCTCEVLYSILKGNIKCQISTDIVHVLMNKITRKHVTNDNEIRVSSDNCSIPTSDDNFFPTYLIFQPYKYLL